MQGFLKTIVYFVLFSAENTSVKAQKAESSIYNKKRSHSLELVRCKQAVNHWTDKWFGKNSVGSWLVKKYDMGKQGKKCLQSTT